MKCIVDLHNHLDTLNLLLRSRGLLQKHLFSLSQYKKENTKIILNVSLYINFYRDYEDLVRLIHEVKNEIKNSSDDFILITKKSDLDKQFSLGIILHLESARILKNYKKQLPELFDFGVRGIIPLHFIDNHLGNSCDDFFRRFNLKRQDHGITKDGEHFIHLCNELGMWIDLTHTSDQTAEDMLELSKNVMVSHIGFRDLKPFPRNKTLSFFKKVADKNGIMGLTPWCHLTGPTSEDYLQHYQLAMENNLSKHIAIGTDFGAPIKTDSQLKNIFDIANLITDDNFIFDNALNFLKRSLPNE